MYKDYCLEFYFSDKTMDKVDKLVEMETNIWASIYRSLNRKKDIQYTKLTSPTLKVTKLDLIF